MATPERPGYATNYMAALIREGLSATGGLRAYREAGGTIRTQNWYRAWGEVQASIGRAGMVAEAPLGRRPLAAEVSTWETRRRSGYVFQVEAQLRQVGTSEVFTTYTSFRTDRLTTYGEALDAALGAFADQMAEYGEQVMGGVVTGVYALVPGG